jgi:hypothetical protein
MAKRSATEGASIFDVCLHLKLIDEERYRKGREILIGVVSMLTRVAKITD